MPVPVSRRLRFTLEYAGLRIVSALLRLVPLELATEVAALAARVLLQLVNPRRHRIALANLRIAFPEKSEAERIAICMRHWKNLGRVVVETLQMDRVLRDPSRIEVADQIILDRYRSKLGPMIGVSLHLGNWELAIWPLVMAGANPAALYRFFDNPYVDRFIRAQRKSLYPGGLIGRGKADDLEGDDFPTVRLVTDYVRRGGRIGIVCDQYYRRGVPVLFFGRITRMQPIAAMTARRSGGRIWMARCLRVGGGSRFRVEIKELQVPRSGNQGRDIYLAIAAMSGQFEAWIREAPDQWFWGNRKWH